MTTKLIKAILDNYNRTQSNSFEAKEVATFYKLFESVRNNIVMAETSGIIEQKNYNLIEIEVLCEYSQTSNGSYKFLLPYIAEIFNPFAALLGLQMIGVETSVEVVKTIEVSSKLIGKINKAAKFVSKDNLRNDLPCVLLHFKDNSLQVVSTDAHKLYMSEVFEIEYKGEAKILIRPESFAKLTKHKTSGKKIKLEFTPLIKELVYSYESANGKEWAESDLQTIFIDGVKVELLHNQTYPDYSVIVPQYESKMVFNRKALIGLCNEVGTAANKSTHQISFHLNGNIQATAQDVDFSFVATNSIPYIRKDFIDCDIAFNGKFLVDILKSFNTSTNLEFQSNGNKFNAAIITDNEDTCLLMPLMLNN